MNEKLDEITIRIRTIKLLDNDKNESDYQKYFHYICDLECFPECDHDNDQKDCIDLPKLAEQTLSRVPQEGHGAAHIVLIRNDSPAAPVAAKRHAISHA